MVSMPSRRVRVVPGSGGGDSAKKASEMCWEECEFCWSPLPLRPRDSLVVVVLKGIMSAVPLPFLAPWLRPGAAKKSEKLMAWLRSSLPSWLQHGQTKGHVTSGSGRRQIPPATPEQSTSSVK